MTVFVPLCGLIDFFGVGIEFHYTDDALSVSVPIDDDVSLSLVRYFLKSCYWVGVLGEHLIEFFLGYRYECGTILSHDIVTCPT